MKRKIRKLAMLCLLVVGLMFCLTGCRKPYDIPEFVTIEASQTAFLIPLTGDTTEQASFESEEMLEQAIPHRWVQTGRRNWQGDWRPSAKLIVVERKPVSRSWESGDSAATSQNAIWGETSDGIGFYVGMSCSAQINEEDATSFCIALITLHWKPSLIMRLKPWLRTSSIVRLVNIPVRNYIAIKLIS